MPADLGSPEWLRVRTAYSHEFATYVKVIRLSDALVALEARDAALDDVAVNLWRCPECRFLTAEPAWRAWLASDEAVERVARAANLDAGRQRGLAFEDDWDQITEQERGGWRLLARAVLAALRGDET